MTYCGQDRCGQRESVPPADRFRQHEATANRPAEWCAGLRIARLDAAIPKGTCRAVLNAIRTLALPSVLPIVYGIASADDGIGCD